MSEYKSLMQFGTCFEGVTRAGEYQPCDKTAAAIRIDPETCTPYPVCAYHARGEMVPLGVILADLTRELP